MVSILGSNAANIPFTDDYFAELNAIDGGDAEAYSAAYRRDGVVLLRGYLDRASIFDLRRRYFQLFGSSLLKPGTDPGDGIYSGEWPSTLPAFGTAQHPAFAFVRSSIFRTFADNGRLRGLAATLLGGPVKRLQRTPLRHFVAGRPFASRAHIDFTYLDRGSPEFVTLWIPLGDCPLECGGLIYLEQSIGLDLPAIRAAASSDRVTDHRPVTHDLKALSEYTGRRWLWSNLAAGDVFAHSPFIVHASLNTLTERMRVSTDIRFRLASGVGDPRWSQDWSATDGY